LLQERKSRGEQKPNNLADENDIAWTFKDKGTPAIRVTDSRGTHRRSRRDGTRILPFLPQLFFNGVRQAAAVQYRQAMLAAGHRRQGNASGSGYPTPDTRGQT